MIDHHPTVRLEDVFGSYTGNHSNLSYTTFSGQVMKVNQANLQKLLDAYRDANYTVHEVINYIGGVDQFLAFAKEQKYDLITFQKLAPENEDRAGVFITYKQKQHLYDVETYAKPVREGIVQAVKTISTSVEAGAKTLGSWTAKELEDLAAVSNKLKVRLGVNMGEELVTTTGTKVRLNPGSSELTEIIPTTVVQQNWRNEMAIIQREAMGEMPEDILRALGKSGLNASSETLLMTAAKEAPWIQWLEEYGKIIK